MSFSRDEFACYLAACGYVTGAEIGVGRGEYSEVLCRANPRLRLSGIDAWVPYAGYRDFVQTSQLERFYAEARARLAPYQVTLIRQFSPAAAQTFQDRSLDFVYIDANHWFASVVADLVAWVPKVRSGGIVAGHDYGRTRVGHVKQAVDGWVFAHKIHDLRVLTADRSHSFFWVQP